MAKSTRKRLVDDETQGAQGAVTTAEAAPAHPSLFGRFTAVMSGHEQLGATLRRLREMSRVLACGGAGLRAELEPAPLLAALRVELEEHFAIEEADAYFGTIALERPDLSGKIAQLVAEHAATLKTVASLEVLAQTAERLAELASPTLRLLDDLATHEKTETSVMAAYLSLG